MQIPLHIVDVRLDPHCASRLKSGNFRINQELNEEWVDIYNQSPYTLNLQERMLVCCQRQGLQSHPEGFRVLRKVKMRSPQPIALYPGEKIRIFSGEQPHKSTHIADEDKVNRVLWLVQRTYLWLPEGNEAHLYFSSHDLKQGNPPLARYILR